tara:strand:+ start:1436 stop:1639 length:204 start_codon:yes stop_codon:yes gene_type:complete
MPGRDFIRDKDSVRFRQIDIVTDDIKMLQDEIKSLKEEIKKIHLILQFRPEEKVDTDVNSGWWYWGS